MKLKTILAESGPVRLDITQHINDDFSHDWEDECIVIDSVGDAVFLQRALLDFIEAATKEK